MYIIYKTYYKNIKRLYILKFNMLLLLLFTLTAKFMFIQEYHFHAFDTNFSTFKMQILLAYNLLMISNIGVV